MESTSPTKPELGTQPVAKSCRLPGLERLRVSMTLAVVGLHAAIAYLVHPFPDLAWAATDESSLVAEHVAWLANAIVMPTFFMLSGFGLSGLIVRHGHRGMFRDRLRRIGVPFLVGCVLILPLDLYTWLLGYVTDGRITMRELQTLKLNDAAHVGLWGPSHLWFLQYLVVFCGVIAFFPAITRWAASQQKLVSSTGLLVGAAITSLPLLAKPEIFLGFHHTLLPIPATLLFYLPMLLFGLIWSNVDTDRLGWQHVVTGLVAWTGSMPWREAWLSGDSTDVVTRLIAVVGYTTAGWFIAAGLFGVARRSDRPLGSVTRYLAGASFWIYMFHHPAVGLTQVALLPLELDPTAKFCATFSIVLWLSLGTYEICVRRTTLGVLLGATKPASRNSDGPATVSLPHPAEVAAQSTSAEDTTFARRAA